MTDRKVSIIIPIYNEEDYLEECLDSVLAQTLEEIEVICVDDGSTDRSVKILEEYARRDARMVILRQENCYAGAARNLGMQAASGRYLSFLDADDFFSPFLIERMYETAEKEHADIVICNAEYYDSSTGQISRKEAWEAMPRGNSCFSGSDVSDQLFQITNGWAWDKLFSADFIRRKDLQYSGTRTANDGYFVYMAMAQAARIVKIEDYLVTQRINNSSSLCNTRNGSWHCGFQMLYDIRKGLADSRLYDKLENTYLNFALDYVIWSFEAMGSFAVKKEIYQCIQNECGGKIPMNHLSEENCGQIEKYEKYRYMMTHSFEEYLTVLFEEKGKIIKQLQQERKRLHQRIQQKVWPFPYSSIEKDSLIVLYGAGRVGQDYYRQIIKSGYCRPVLWLDKRFGTGSRELPIQGWRDELAQISFHKIIIALLQKEEAESAIGMLKEWGIPKEKILWKPEGI